MPYGATKATRSKGYKVTMNTNGTATVREGAEGQLKTGAVGAPVCACWKKFWQERRELNPLVVLLI